MKFEQRLRLFSVGNDKGDKTTLTVSVSGQCLCFMFRLRRVSVRVRVTNLVNSYLDFIRLRMLCSKSDTNERMSSLFAHSVVQRLGCLGRSPEYKLYKYSCIILYIYGV